MEKDLLFCKLTTHLPILLTTKEKTDVELWVQCVYQRLKIKGHNAISGSRQPIAIEHKKWHLAFV
jgi:hypothetical protein